MGVSRALHLQTTLAMQKTRRKPQHSVLRKSFKIKPRPVLKARKEMDT